MSNDNNDGITPEMILEDLKAQADRLGVDYHPNIGVDKLQERIQEFKDKQAKADQEASDKAAADAKAKVDADAKDPVKAEAQRKLRRRLEQKNDAMKLVRVHISCMNPMKKEWPGEIFTFNNRVVGEVKRYVPFNVDTHVENCVLQILRDRQYQNFISVKGPGGTTRRGQQSVEFGIRELEPLTEQELRELARRQAMAAGQE